MFGSILLSLLQWLFCKGIKGPAEENFNRTTIVQCTQTLTHSHSHIKQSLGHKRYLTEQGWHERIWIYVMCGYRKTKDLLQYKGECISHTKARKIQIISQLEQTNIFSCTNGASTTHSNMCMYYLHSRYMKWIQDKLLLL